VTFRGTETSVTIYHIALRHRSEDRWPLLYLCWIHAEQYCQLNQRNCPCENRHSVPALTWGARLGHRSVPPPTRRDWTTNFNSAHKYSDDVLKGQERNCLSRVKWLLPLGDWLRLQSRTLHFYVTSNDVIPFECHALLTVKRSRPHISPIFLKYGHMTRGLLQILTLCDRPVPYSLNSQWGLIREDECMWNCKQRPIVIWSQCSTNGWQMTRNYYLKWEFHVHRKSRASF
jgi:hypothetical protein